MQLNAAKPPGFVLQSTYFDVQGFYWLSLVAVSRAMMNLIYGRQKKRTKVAIGQI